jgi:CRP/FNR family cyclic AMP-dependent transcriptional regulator
VSRTASRTKSPATPAPAAAAAPTHIQRLAALGTERLFRKGVLLIQEGDLGDTLYVVLSGRLRAYAADDRGREITLGLYGPGEYVGEMSLDGGPRSANVETMEATRCSVVDRDALLSYIGQHPDFALEMMKRLIRRARLATQSARALALIDVYGRLRQLLEGFAQPEDANGERVITDRLTHQQIASHLACSREMVTRLLKDLETGGWIALRERRIVLLRELPTRW